MRNVDNKERPMALREIIEIDEELCDGCGECVPACEEGAIRIVDGKARVIEGLCDGLGHCIGDCPRGPSARCSGTPDRLEGAAPGR
ncbi:MAG: ATP-binding protein [Methanomassiliicoccales archaeon]